MVAILWRIAAWALGGAIARMLTGAGLAVFTYTMVVDYVRDALDYGVSILQGVAGGAVLQLLVLFGVAEALTIVGSALLTRATVVGMAAFIGAKAPGV